MALSARRESPEIRVCEFARKFDSERCAIEDTVLRLRERGFGWPVVLPLLGLVERSFIDGKPSFASRAIFSNAATIIEDVVEDAQDTKGSGDALRFIEMTTAILTRSGRTQTHEDLKALADMVISVAEFTGNLSLRSNITRNDVHEIFELTTLLLGTHVREGNVGKAADAALTLISEIGGTSSSEDIRGKIVEYLTGAVFKYARSKGIPRTDEAAWAPFL